MIKVQSVKIEDCQKVIDLLQSISDFVPRDGYVGNYAYIGAFIELGNSEFFIMN